MKIKELFLNKHVFETVYQVRNASFREGENGVGYYLMRLGDKTGQIDAIWLNTPKINLKVGDFLSIDGKVQNYQGRLQLKISSCYKVSPEQVDQEEYTLLALNESELKNKLHEYVESIRIKPLHKLIKRLIIEELYEEFCRAPAATFNHHAYIGGLLEHSICVTSICEGFLPLYSSLNPDILIAGALVHDIGKVYEFEFGESIAYSTKGNLLGHIYMGAHKFQKECLKEKNFPEYITNSITHIILSHHGTLERGSPVEPKTLEAILVNKADTTDAEANSFITSEDKNAGDNWLISRSLNRMIYIESAPKFELRD